MARLMAGQKLVLQAILDAQGGFERPVEDAQLVQATRITLSDVRLWLESLKDADYIDVVRTDNGLSATITATGRLTLGQFQPLGATPAQPDPPPATNATQAAPPPNPQAASAEPLRLFYCYSQKDLTLRDELEESLSLLKRQKLISGWHDRRIGAGEDWKGAIDKNLEEAQIILLLVSSSFLATDYCWDIELTRAIELHGQGSAIIIPVILRPCDWHDAPFAKFQALPKDAKPVTSWSNKDEAWTDVAVGIRRAAERFKAKGR